MGLRGVSGSTARTTQRLPLADDAGIDRSYISRIERGVTWVGVEIAVKLAAVLECEPYELLVPPRRGRRGG